MLREKTGEKVVRTVRVEREKRAARKLERALQAAIADLNLSQEELMEPVFRKDRMTGLSFSFTGGYL